MAGAIERSKLEANFQEEFSSISSELFPNGTDSQSKITLIEPRAALAEDMLDHLYTLVEEREGRSIIHDNEIILIAEQADTDRSRISSVEITLDSITSTVEAMVNAEQGNTFDLTQVTQNTANIILMATAGRYDPGTGEIDAPFLATVTLTKDRLDALVQGTGDDFAAISEFIVTPDTISATVENLIETSEGVQASISSIVQTDQTIALRVQNATLEAIERIDDALCQAEAGILITQQRIEIGVQDQSEENTTLRALIAITAEDITSEVSRASTAEGYLGSQIVQTADGINLAVWGSTTPGSTPLSTQLSAQAGILAAQVSGGGASAFLSLSVTIPAMIDATMRATFVSNASEAAVAAVYALASNGFYYVKSGATSTQIKTLKSALRTAGLLGSQIALDADEILMGGKITAEQIDATAIIVSASNVSGLGDLAVLYSLSASDVGARASTWQPNWTSDVSDKPGFRGNLASAPSTPIIGDWYFNTTDGKQYEYNGATWDGTLVPTASQVGADASGTAASAASAAKDALAESLGYDSFEALAAQAELGATIILGGYINTELIEVEALLAQDITLGTNGFLMSHDYSFDTYFPTAGFKLDVESQTILAFGAVLARASLRDATIENAYFSGVINSDALTTQNSISTTFTATGTYNGIDIVDALGLVIQSLSNTTFSPASGTFNGFTVTGIAYVDNPSRSLTAYDWIKIRFSGAAELVLNAYGTDYSYAGSITVNQSPKATITDVDSYNAEIAGDILLQVSTTTSVEFLLKKPIMAHIMASSSAPCSLQLYFGGGYHTISVGLNANSAAYGYPRPYSLGPGKYKLLAANNVVAYFNITGIFGSCNATDILEVL